MDTHCIFIGDLPSNDGTGRTIKEANLGIQHNIPVGTLVEVKYEKWRGGGCCEKIHARLWVWEHGRDCDGTPLYILSRHKDSDIFGLEGGFAEESLTPITITPELEYGTDALTWEEE